MSGTVILAVDVHESGLTLSAHEVFGSGLVGKESPRLPAGLPTPGIAPGDDIFRADRFFRPSHAAVSTERQEGGSQYA